MKIKPFPAFLFSIAALVLTSCTFTRLMVFYYEDVNDYKRFPAREFGIDPVKYSFPTAAGDDPMPRYLSADSTYVSFEEFQKARKTVAFLVVRHDTLIYENYFNDYDEASIVPAFSMAKAMMSILIGCAIGDGYIQSVNEPVTNYIPELKPNGFDKVTIENLLQMTSGISYDETKMFPISRLYYGRNLWRIVSKLELGAEPGTEFKYLNVGVQTLGFVLERALKDKTVTEYFREKLWLPLGMEFDGSWNIDRKRNGMEKTYCCINARARDYAKIGSLYLHKGNWQGKQIVSEQWVARSTEIDTANASPWNNQYLWWLPSPDGDFMATGARGQYIYVNPSKDLVIVRLGKDTGGIDWRIYMVEIAKRY